MLFDININKSELIPNVNLDNFEVNNWIVSDFVLKKLVPTVGVRPFPLNELMLLSSAIIRFEPDHVIEWGTNIGKSARVFSETIDYFKLKSFIFSIDLPDNVYHNEHPKNDRGKLVRNKKNVELLLGDGLVVSKKIMSKYGKDSNVLFFLDGDHSFKSVSRELNYITSNYKNAKILIHDTFLQDKESEYNIGPYLAVKKYLFNDDFQFIIEKNGLPGMTLLWRK